VKECYFCKGPLEEQRIQHIHRWGDQIIVFESVPAEVCQQCGEVYFSPEVLEMMDRAMLEDLEPKACISVPVFSLGGILPA